MFLTTIFTILVTGIIVASSFVSVVATKDYYSTERYENSTIQPSLMLPSDQSRDGILLLQPCEILWDSVVRIGLQELRDSRYLRRGAASTGLPPPSDPRYPEMVSLTEVTFRSCFSQLAAELPRFQRRNSDEPSSYPWTRQYATLTMVGAKGGSLIDQTNQDRAMILISPNHPFVISGVMDGHGSHGHSVAEYVRSSIQQRMPAVLQQCMKLQHVNQSSHELDETIKTTLSTALTTLIKDIDHDIPGRIAQHGGTTLSIAVQLQNEYLFFINTGDSQSFLVTVVMRDDSSKLLDVQVHFATQLHKPDHPSERIRLLEAGMRVKDKTTIDDARVWYSTHDPQDNKTTAEYGLAMSRSLGDHSAKAGVIADPTVTIFSIDNVVSATLQNYTNALTNHSDLHCQTKIDQLGETSDTMLCAPSNVTKEQVHLFVVSATDGLIDYLSLNDMAYEIAQALYEEKWHVLSAAESLLHQASAKWYEEYEGQYRDDMAITIAQLV